MFNREASGFSVQRNLWFARGEEGFILRPILKTKLSREDALTEIARGDLIGAGVTPCGEFARLTEL